MKHETHTQHVMRDTEGFYVKLCSCGVVHLCFGPTTLNLSKEALIAVTETLKEVSLEILKETRSQLGLDHADPAGSNVILGAFKSLKTVD